MERAARPGAFGRRRKAREAKRSGGVRRGTQDLLGQDGSREDGC